MPVVLAGDYNVVPTDFDIYYADVVAEGRAAAAREPRRLPAAAGAGLDRRDPHPLSRTSAIYTFWDYMRNRWPRNAGLRIDHLLLSARPRRRGCRRRRRPRGARPGKGQRPRADVGAAALNPAAGPQTARLFLALWPGPAAREALRERSAAWTWDTAAARVPPERLHLTLHFIGGVARSRLAELGPELQLAAPAFELTLDHAEVWRQGIAVLQPTVLPERLLELHRRLGDALQRLALPVEARPFRPHVTLARHASGSAPPAVWPPLRWRVRGYALVESERRPAGGYRVVQRYH